MLPVQPRRSEVRWRTGQEATLAPAFEPEVFRKQMYCIEESACDTVGILGAPIVIRRPGNCAPFPPSLRPCSAVRDSGVDLLDIIGITRGGNVRTIPRPPNLYGGAKSLLGTLDDRRVRRKIPTMSQILFSIQCICFQKTWIYFQKRALWRPQTCYAQGSKFLAPGARTKFGAPIFESEVLWKQIYCIEGSICEIVGNFRRPIRRSHSELFGAPLVISVLGKLLPPCTRSLRP